MSPNLWYCRYTQPLLIQSIMPLKSLYDSKILKIHVLGQPAVGDLKRPFAQPPGYICPSFIHDHRSLAC